MKKLSCFYVIVMLFFAVPAFADIYKCVSDDGVVTYSDQPCASDAEVAFETENLNFDDAIGNASPYTEQLVPASKIDGEDFVAHARKIGKYIFPYEYNNSYVNQTTPMSRGWRILLYFGPENNKRNYRVALEYGRKPTNQGIYVWLNSISVKKDGKPFDPPSMVNVKTYKKMGTGRWQLRLE
jgi:hypothetical protein